MVDFAAGRQLNSRVASSVDELVTEVRDEEGCLGSRNTHRISQWRVVDAIQLTTVAQHRVCRDNLASVRLDRRDLIGVVHLAHRAGRTSIVLFFFYSPAPPGLFPVSLPLAFPL